MATDLLKGIKELVHVPSGNVIFSGGGNEAPIVIEGSLIGYSDNYLLSYSENNTYGNKIYLYKFGKGLLWEKQNTIRSGNGALINESTMEIFVSLDGYITKLSLLDGTQIAKSNAYSEKMLGFDSNMDIIYRHGSVRRWTYKLTMDFSSNTKLFEYNNEYLMSDYMYGNYIYSNTYQDSYLYIYNLTDGSLTSRFRNISYTQYFSNVNIGNGNYYLCNGIMSPLYGISVSDKNGKNIMSMYLNSKDGFSALIDDNDLLFISAYKFNDSSTYLYHLYCIDISDNCKKFNTYYTFLKCNSNKKYYIAKIIGQNILAYTRIPIGKVRDYIFPM